MKPSLRLFRNCTLFSTHCAPCRGVSPLSACSCPVHGSQGSWECWIRWDVSNHRLSILSCEEFTHTHTHYKCHYLVELHWGFLDTRTQMLAPLWGAHFTTSMQPTTPGQSRTPWHLSPCQACSRSSRVPFYPSAFLITSEIGDHHPHLLSKMIRQILGTFQTFLTPTAQWTAASWNSRVNIDVSLSHHTCYAGPCST